MTAVQASIFDLIEVLMLAGMSPETSLIVSRQIDELFQLSTRSSGSDEERREKWRLKKARQRAARSNVPGGQSRSALIEVNTSNPAKEKKKVSKSETMSPDVPLNVPGDKPKRSKGEVLPADWAPTDAHYEKGAELGMTRQVVDGFAARMRNWAEANAHRQVARKAGVRGWNAAFSNWLASAHERNSGGVSSHGKTQGTGGIGFSGIAARLRERVTDTELPIGKPPAGS